MNDSENPKSKVSRRTIVGAAAWSAPAIALSAASPAQAASQPAAPPVPTLAFTNERSFTAPSAYTGPGFYAAYYGSDGSGGWTLRGPEIAASPDGKSPASVGDQITITLPDGLKFSNGSTTKVYFASGNPTSLEIPPTDIAVPTGTKAGTYTITVEYKGLTESAAITVIEGGVTWAWGYAGGGVANGNAGSTYLSRPVQWGYSSTRISDPITFTTYTAITGSLSNLAAYSDLYEDLITTGDTKGLYRRKFSIDRLVSNNKGNASDTVFFWGTDGLLYAFGVNASNMFSVAGDTGNGTVYTYPVAAGAMILDANPGKKIVSVHTAAGRASYILDDGTVWSAGANTGTAMGNNDAWGGSMHTATQTVKPDGTPLTDISTIACATQSSVFIDKSGNLWGAGQQSSQRQLAYGGGYNSITQTAVPLDLPDGKQAKKIWGVDNTFIVQAIDDTCYFCGSNNYGQPSSPLGLSQGAWRQMTIAAGKTVADIGMSGSHGALYLMTDGTLYFAGNNSYNGRGDGTATGNTTTMVKVPLTGTVVDFAITSNNTYAAIVK